MVFLHLSLFPYFPSWVEFHPIGNILPGRFQTSLEGVCNGLFIKSSPARMEALLGQEFAAFALYCILIT